MSPHLPSRHHNSQHKVSTTCQTCGCHRSSTHDATIQFYCGLLISSTLLSCDVGVCLVHSKSSASSHHLFSVSAVLLTGNHFRCQSPTVPVGPASRHQNQGASETAAVPRYCSPHTCDAIPETEFAPFVFQP